MRSLYSLLKDRDSQILGDGGCCLCWGFVEDKRVGTKKEQEGEQKKFDLAGRSWENGKSR
jgi:hypothetical protein